MWLLEPSGTWLAFVGDATVVEEFEAYVPRGGAEVRPEVGYISQAIATMGARAARSRRSGSHPEERLGPSREVGGQGR